MIMTQKEPSPSTDKNSFDEAKKYSKEEKKINTVQKKTNYPTKVKIRKIEKNKYTKKTFIETAREYHSVKFEPSQISKINLLVSHLVEKKQGLKQAIKCLTNKIWIKGLSKQDQAYSTLLSIEVLKYYGKNEEIEPLEETIKKLLKNFRVKKRNTKISLKITELLTSWIEIYGKKNLLSKPTQIFINFNYQPDYRPLFATALRYSFPQKINNKDFQNIFLSLLKRNHLG